MNCEESTALGGEEYYILVRNGNAHMQMWTVNDRPTKVLPVGVDHGTAKEMAEYLGIWSTGFRPRRIGTGGGTFRGECVKAVQEGCIYLLVFGGCEEDGELIWDVIDLRSGRRGGRHG